ncbi:MAG: hypothetical protein ACXVSE_13295, partial [Solirubrobacteraceae bacterium]
MPIATRIEANVCRSLCGVIPSGSGLHPALLGEPVRVRDRGVDDVLAEVVAGACRPGGGDEHGIVRTGPLARGLVLGQDLPQQRQHVDLAHARVGLVAADLEPAVGEVDVTPQHRSGR